MKIIHNKVGPIHTNCFIVFDENTNKACVIDPGEKALLLLEQIKENNLSLEYILLTHGHFDHIIAVKKLQDATGAKVVIHKNDAKMLDKAYVNQHYGKYIRGEYEQPKIDILAVDGTEIAVSDKLLATFINTKGHTKGSCVIKIENSLFTGDTLFAGECGRCDLEGGNFEQMLESLKRLYELDGNFDVYPGHEGFSTLEEERKYNRYMKQAVGK